MYLYEKKMGSLFLPSFPWGLSNQKVLKKRRGERSEKGLWRCSMPPKSKFGPREAKIAAYATPFVLLALLLVLVLVNIKHNMLCDQGGESAAEAMLKRQALEKRLLSLEQETLQNNILFEKFIRRLDDQFQITKDLDLTPLKNKAHAAAMSISARLAEEPAPPMPSFSELYGNDPNGLNDAIDTAIEQGLDDYGYGKGADDIMRSESGKNSGESGGSSEGSGRVADMKLADDMQDDVFDDKRETNGGAGSNYAYNSKGVDAEEALAVPEAEAKPQCLDWKATYSVQPGIAWGSLPFDLQNKWKVYDCDKWTMSGVGDGGFGF